MGRVTHADTQRMMAYLLAKGDETTKPLTFTALTSASTVTLKKTGSPPAISLEYSIGGEWSTYTIGTQITLATAGDSVSFRGDNATFSVSSVDYYNFAMSGSVMASGNVMSLVDSTYAARAIPCEWCFWRLFDGCAALVAAPILPATKLTFRCYAFMFYKCSALEIAPNLPATTLSPFCYYYMFDSCGGLLVAPTLHATALAEHCYGYMLRACRSLTSLPALPATSLAVNCYNNMLAHCVNLSSIEVNFSSWTAYAAQTENWVYGVAASGTFKKPASLPEIYGVNNIPVGWTVVDK